MDSTGVSVSDRSLELGARLAQARSEAGFNQHRAGKRLGVSLNTISRWECGEVDPLYSHVEAAAKLYEVSLDWLSGRVQHKKGLTPGYTIVDARALARLRQAVEKGETLADIVVDDIMKPPGADIAFDVPEEFLLLSPKAAKELHYEIKKALQTLQRRSL